MHPAWEKCPRHYLQRDTGVVLDIHNGVVTLRVNCGTCGCPGLAYVELPTQEVEWGKANEGDEPEPSGKDAK